MLAEAARLMRAEFRPQSAHLTRAFAAPIDTEDIRDRPQELRWPEYLNRPRTGLGALPTASTSWCRPVPPDRNPGLRRRPRGPPRSRRSAIVPPRAGRRVPCRCGIERERSSAPGFGSRHASRPRRGVSAPPLEVEADCLFVDGAIRRSTQKRSAELRRLAGHRSDDRRRFAALRPAAMPRRPSSGKFRREPLPVATYVPLPDRRCLYLKGSVLAQFRPELRTSATSIGTIMRCGSTATASGSRSQTMQRSGPRPEPEPGPRALIAARAARLEPALSRDPRRGRARS